MNFISVLQQYSGILIIIFAVLFIIVFIMQIIINSKVSKIRKRINAFMDNTDGEKNIEQLIMEYFDEVKSMNSKHESIMSSINSINNRLKYCIQKIGIVRYNPFDDVGGDLCFAVALLDANNDGVVLNSIYSREGCYTYAKPIKGGLCEKYKLSGEEEEAVINALKTV